MTATDDAIEAAYQANRAYVHHSAFDMSVSQIISVVIASGHLIPVDDPELVTLRAQASQQLVEKETWKDAALRDQRELVTLRAIVNTIKNSAPKFVNGYCTWCSAPLIANHEITVDDHYPSCVWRSTHLLLPIFH